eukprot:2426275-Rhodomonas_salina.2
MIRSAPFAASNSNYAMQQQAFFPLQMQMQMRKPMPLLEFQIRSPTPTTPSAINFFGLQLSKCDTPLADRHSASSDFCLDSEDWPMLSLDKENDDVNIMSCSSFQIRSSTQLQSRMLIVLPLIATSASSARIS